MHGRLKTFQKLHLIISDYFFCLKREITSCISIVQACNQRAASSNLLILPQKIWMTGALPVLDDPYDNRYIKLHLRGSVFTKPFGVKNIFFQTIQMF